MKIFRSTEFYQHLFLSPRNFREIPLKSLDQAGIEASFFNMTTRVTYGKYATQFPDVVATLILPVFEFPVIHSHPYNKFIYLNVGKLNETCTLGTLEMTFLICLLIIMHFAPNKVP